MAAVAAGATAAGGLVIGVRPDSDRAGGCDGLSAVLYTNLGEARNAIIVASADAVVVIGGSWGTLSELALARARQTPVVSLGGWRVSAADGTPVDTGIRLAQNAESAVAQALSATGGD